MLLIVWESRLSILKRTAIIFAAITVCLAFAQLAWAAPQVSVNGGPWLSQDEVPGLKRMVASNEAFYDVWDLTDIPNQDPSLPPWRKHYWGEVFDLDNWPQGNTSPESAPGVLRVDFTLPRPKPADLEAMVPGIAQLDYAAREYQGPAPESGGARLVAVRSSAWEGRLPGHMSMLTQAEADRGGDYLSGGPADSHEQAGYLALQLRTGALGFTIGGGYERTSLATSEAGSSAGGGFSAASLSTGPTRGGSQYNSVGRWSAFVAMPYQISERVGILPEFSYYHGDAEAKTEVEGDEWVMGLQFQFGF